MVMRFHIFVLTSKYPGTGILLSSLCTVNVLLIDSQLVPVHSIRTGILPVQYYLHYCRRSRYRGSVKCSCIHNMRMCYKYI
jgi:hypothetical protein